MNKDILAEYEGLETGVLNSRNFFYTDGTVINGYTAIYNRENEEIIWIDCPDEYLLTIVKALNSKHKND